MESEERLQKSLQELRNMERMIVELHNLTDNPTKLRGLFCNCPNKVADFIALRKIEEALREESNSTP